MARLSDLQFSNHSVEIVKPIIVRIAQVNALQPNKGEPVKWKLVVTDGNVDIDCTVIESLFDKCRTLKVNSALKMTKYIPKLFGQSQKKVIILSDFAVMPMSTAGLNDNTEVSSSAEDNLGASTRSKIEEIYPATPMLETPIKKRMTSSGEIVPTVLSETQSTQSKRKERREILPVNTLQPGSFIQKPRHLLVRVTLKSEVTQYPYNSPIKMGCFLKINLCDASGEVPVIAYNSACKHIGESCELGKLYYFSNFKVGKDNYSDQCLLTVYDDTFVALCEDDVPERFPTPPTQLFNFKAFNLLKDVFGSERQNVHLDVIGVADFIYPCNSLKVNSTDRKKQEVRLIDNTGYSFILVLWDSHTTFLDNFKDNDHPIISVKNAKVGTFNAISLNCYTGDSQIFINQDIPRAAELRIWYDSQTTQFEPEKFLYLKNLLDDPITTIAELRDKCDVDERLLKIKAQICKFGGTDFLYQSCCNKKVVMENGVLRCVYPSCVLPSDNWKLQLRFRVCLADESVKYDGNIANIWLTCFNDVAVELLRVCGLERCTIEDLRLMKEQDPVEFNASFDRLRHKALLFFVKCCMKEYQGAPQLNVAYIRSELL